MVKTSATLNRRQVLTTFVSVVALHPLQSHAQKQDTFDKTAFLRISSLVTGLPTAQLTGLADPLFKAFQPQAAMLLQVEILARTTPPEGFLAAIAGTPLEPPCQLLASAWYTGMLGAGRSATLVSYDDALVWPAVGYDAAPGSCAGDFGFWANPAATH